MLPYTVNSPRAYNRGKSKTKSNSARWGILAVLLLCGGAGTLWYFKSRSAQLSTLLSVITEHENKYTHLTAENEKKDSEIRRLNRALEAAKADRDKVQEDVTLRNARIEEAETNWRTSAEELAALKKLHDGVHGQLREALDRTILQDQETIEARSELAKCYQMLNASNESSKGKTEGAAPGLVAAGASKVLNASSQVVAEVVAAVNSSIGNVTQLGQQTASQGTSEDDETTYPGLEQPLLPQQELRRSLQSIPVDLTLNMSEVRELVVL